MNIYISNKVCNTEVFFVFNNDNILCKSVSNITNLNLQYLNKSGEFKKGLYSIAQITDYKNDKKMIFLRLGNETELNSEIIRRAAYHLIKYCESNTIRAISINLEDDNKKLGEYIKALSESAILSSYRYTEYLTNKEKNYLEEIIINTEQSDEIQNSLMEAINVANSVNICRDLVNEPSNIQTPVRLGDEVKSLSNIYGFDVNILDENDIKALNMQAFYEVAKGSINKPVLIVMKYFGDSNSDEIIGLIGKGVTYDSGGLNLKSGSRFITMKHDMAGSATVIGAMCAIAKQRLKANVVAVVAACENLISNTAYKPGDIIGSMAGKTILINSTDAEGRLTLIDAITYAIEKEKVTKIIDIATLTGASRRMFGDYLSSVMCNDDNFYSSFQEASIKTGELVCRVPEIEDAVSEIKGEISDYINTSASETCGMITASLFIREFVQNKPWIHIDGAGPCWLEKNKYYNTKGGSGWGTRLLYQTVKENCGK